MTPVGPALTSPETTPQPAQVEHASFAWLQPEEPTSVPGVTRVDSITLSLRLANETVSRHLPAPAIITGDPISLRTIFARNALPPEELAELMLQAHRQHGHLPESLAQQTLQKARTAQSSREQAIRLGLQEYLDTLSQDFEPEHPPLTATSHDGRITATVSPRPAHL